MTVIYCDCSTREINNCMLVFQSLNVPDTPSVSPSKSTKVGRKYGLSKHTSKAKERKAKDRLIVCTSVSTLTSVVSMLSSTRHTHARTHARKHARTHARTRLMALFPGLPRWGSTRKVEPIWILLKQETVSGSGISRAISKSASRSRQTKTPAPHHSVFYRPDALSATQPTVSKHWRQSALTAPHWSLIAGCQCRLQLVSLTDDLVLKYFIALVSVSSLSLLHCWLGER